MKETAPVSPRLPPNLAKIERTSLAVRLRLSVKRLDDDADAAGAEALVAHFLVIGAAGLLALLDRPLDIVLGHVLGAGGDDGGPEPRVHGRVRHAHLRRGRDLAGEL